MKTWPKEYGCLEVSPWRSYPSGVTLRVAAGLNQAPGLHVRHRCDNQRCVERTHLVAGTRSENRRDCYRRVVIVLLSGRVLFALRWKATALWRKGFLRRLSLGIYGETSRGSRRGRRLLFDAIVSTHSVMPLSRPEPEHFARYSIGG